MKLKLFCKNKKKPLGILKKQHSNNNLEKLKAELAIMDHQELKSSILLRINIQNLIIYSKIMRLK